MSSKSEIPDHRCPEWIVIGKITRPVGLKGAVNIYPLTDFPERYGELGRVRLQRGDRIEYVHVRSVGQRGARFVLNFEECTDRKDAEALKGYLITIPGSALPLLPDDDFYPFQLLGMQVVDLTGTVLGSVIDTYSVRDEDLLEIERVEEKGTFLLPFVKKFVKSVDVSGNTMVVDLIDGFD